MISLDYNLITIFHVPFIIHYFSYFSTLRYDFNKNGLILRFLVMLTIDELSSHKA